MWKGVILALSLLLSGCMWNDKPTDATQPRTTIVHPSWPVTVQPYRFDWRVVVINDEEVLVGLSYDQSLDFRLFLEDVKRYMGESNRVICYYREELKESRCVDTVSEFK